MEFYACTYAFWCVKREKKKQKRDNKEKVVSRGTYASFCFFFFFFISYVPHLKCITRVYYCSASMSGKKRERGVILLIRRTDIHLLRVIFHHDTVTPRGLERDMHSELTIHS